MVIRQPILVKAHPQQAHSNRKPGGIVDSVAPLSYILKVDGRKYRRNGLTCGRDTIQSSKSQPNGQQTSTAETTNSSPNKNASQEDSSDTPPLPEQNCKMTCSVDPVTLTIISPVTRTRSGRVVKLNTPERLCLTRDFIIRRS